MVDLGIHKKVSPNAQRGGKPYFQYCWSRITNCTAVHVCVQTESIPTRDKDLSLGATVQDASEERYKVRAWIPVTGRAQPVGGFLLLLLIPSIITPRSGKHPGKCLP